MIAQKEKETVVSAAQVNNMTREQQRQRIDDFLDNWAVAALSASQKQTWAAIIKHYMDTLEEDNDRLLDEIFSIRDKSN